MSTFSHFRPQGIVTKATSNGDVSINGQTNYSQSSATASGSACQAPLIDDSLIADDDGGLPLISAVYSLATNANQQNCEESTGISVTSNASSPPIINLGKAVSLNPSALIKDLNSLGAPSVKAKLSTGISTSALQNRLSPPSNSVGTSPLIVKTPSETSRSEGTLTSEPYERKASAHAPDRRGQQSSGVLQLVKLVDSVSKQPPPPPLTTPTTVNSQSSSLVSQTSLTGSSLVKQGAHPPRQIAMKQPGSTTSIVLNLKPGEPLPKAINLLGPDGKSVVFLSLTDGGKPLPPQIVQAGGKILIPISSSIGSSVATNQISFINKVPSVSSGQVPIAPHPGKTAVLSRTAISSPVRLSVSESSGSQKPLVATTVVPNTVVPNTVVPTTVLAKIPTVASTTLGSPDSLPTSSRNSPTSTPSEAKPLASTVENKTGLSPQEARIQRLKELIKTQEDAVNKLREKRRLEMEKIRDQSSISKPDSEGNEFKSERTPPARSSSPFAVPFPPKKRNREQDSSFKSKVPRSTDSAVMQGEGAFIPNGDDKSFVQLIGLEKVVSNIK